MTELMTITQTNFEAEVATSAMPVFVEFWAPWCGPCRAVADTLKELSAEYEGKMKFVKINVDDEEALAERHNITSIPSMLIYKDGAVVKQRSGAAPKAALEMFIKN